MGQNKKTKNISTNFNRNETASALLKLLRVRGALLLWLGFTALITVLLAVLGRLIKTDNIVIITVVSVPVQKYLCKKIKEWKDKKGHKEVIALANMGVGFAVALNIFLPVQSMANEARYRIGIFIAGDDRTTEEIDVIDNSDEISSYIYGDETTFILDDNGQSFEITSDLLNMVYNYIPPEEMVEFTYRLRGSKTPKSNISKIINGSIQDHENYFYNAVEKAIGCPNKNSDWYRNLVHSTQLLDIISEEEEYAELYSNSFIYNRLSNHYQKMAQEYDHQKKDQDAVKYYYMKSIACDYKCISFATEKDSAYYHESMKRLYYRYGDILLCCKDVITNDETERLQALLKNLLECK